MALTDAEKARVKYHLGYMLVSSAAALNFGLPKPIQTLFLVELALEKIQPGDLGENKVREIIGILDEIECQMVDAQPNLAASQLGELHTRENQIDLLEKEYLRWGRRLGNVLGVPPYAFAERYQGVSANIPVRH